MAAAMTSTDIALLLARLIGIGLMAHGAQKLTHWFGGRGVGGTATWMEARGFRPGIAFALIAGVNEVLGGFLLTAGFGGPVGPMLVIATMVVAIFAVHGRFGFFVQNQGYEPALTYITLVLVLAFTGYGRLSLDQALGLTTWYAPTLTWTALAAGALGGFASVASRRPNAEAARALLTPELSTSKNALFASLTLRDVTIRNRIMVSPMCQYSSFDGFANDWHFVHLGSRAVGGAGLVFTEATAVEPRGRISRECLGIYKDEHVELLSRIARFIEEHGAVPGVQLAHAGRKGSTVAPWDRGGPDGVTIEQGGWIPIAPSAIPFADTYITPHELRMDEVPEILQFYRDAVRRARDAGFKALEVHGAYGYLLHQFLSPLTNKRTDRYGGSFENRIRLTLEVVDSVRDVWPERYPLFLRMPVTDWHESGWNEEEAVALAREVAKHGVDVVDCVSGSVAQVLQPPQSPLYQVPLSRRVRREAGVMTAAVGVYYDGGRSGTNLA